MGRLQYFFLGWGSVYICRHVYFSGIQKHVLSVTLCCVPALIVNVFKEAATVHTCQRKTSFSCGCPVFVNFWCCAHLCVHVAWKSEVGNFNQENLTS